MPRIDEDRLDELVDALIDAAQEYERALADLEGGSSATREYNARGEARAALMQYVLGEE